MNKILTHCPEAGAVHSFASRVYEGPEHYDYEDLGHKDNWNDANFVREAWYFLIMDLLLLENPLVTKLINRHQQAIKDAAIDDTDTLVDDDAIMKIIKNEVK